MLCKDTSCAHNDLRNGCLRTGAEIPFIRPVLIDDCHYSVCDGYEPSEADDEHATVEYWQTLTPEEVYSDNRGRHPH